MQKLQRGNSNGILVAVTMKRWRHVQFGLPIDLSKSIWTVSWRSRWRLPLDEVRTDGMRSEGECGGATDLCQYSSNVYVPFKVANNKKSNNYSYVHTHTHTVTKRENPTYILALGQAIFDFICCANRRNALPSQWMMALTDWGTISMFLNLKPYFSTDCELNLVAT